jgi:hypothetical protein
MFAAFTALLALAPLVVLLPTDPALGAGLSLLVVTTAVVVHSLVLEPNPYREERRSPGRKRRRR